MDHRPGFTGQITRAAARHPWRTLGLWVVLVVAAFGANQAMDLVAEPATGGTEATKAMNLIDDRLREETPMRLRGNDKRNMGMTSVTWDRHATFRLLSSDFRPLSSAFRAVFPLVFNKKLFIITALYSLFGALLW